MKLGLFFIGIGILGILHQELLAHASWDWTQFRHHETLITACIAFGAGWLTGGIIRWFRRYQNE